MKQLLLALAVVLSASVHHAFAASPGHPADPALAFAQSPVDALIKGLSSPDVKVRLLSATMLKDAANADAAIPLARAIGDVDNDVQLEAIRAELNIFLAGPIGPKGRPGVAVVEDRGKPAAQSAFEAGPFVLGGKPVPPEVLLAMRTASHDDSPRVSVEALYAFGTLTALLPPQARREQRAAMVAELASILNSRDPASRIAAVRVIGRLYARTPAEPPIDPRLGDLVIAAINESSPAMRLAAMDTLGAVADTRGIAGLTALYNFYGKGEMAEAALGALSRIGDPSSAPLFLLALGSKVPVIKTMAIEGLARTGDATHMAAVEAALKRDLDDRVFGAGDFAGAMLANGTIDRIVDALNRPGSRDAAREYLIEIARKRVSSLSRYIQDPDPRLRADMADIIGMSGEPEGLAIIAPLLTDRYKPVAVAAARATLRLQTNQ